MDKASSLWKMTTNYHNRFDYYHWFLLVISWILQQLRKFFTKRSEQEHLITKNVISDLIPCCYMTMNWIHVTSNVELQWNYVTKLLVHRYISSYFQRLKFLTRLSGHQNTCYQIQDMLEKNYNHIRCPTQKLFHTTPILKESMTYLYFPWEDISILSAQLH